MSMKNTLLCLVLIALASAGGAQNISMNLSMAASKNYKIGKEFRLGFRAKAWITPEIDQLDIVYDDLFDDFNLLSSSQEKDEDDELDERAGASSGPTGLNDEAFTIEAELRSSFRTEVQWRPGDWFQLRGRYTVSTRPDDALRHSWVTQLRARPDIDSRRFRVEQRLNIQHNARKRRGAYQWSHGGAIQSRVQYKLSDRHDLYWSPSIRFDVEGRRLNWDRLVSDVGLYYEFMDKHQFHLRYRIQKRIDRADGTLGHGFGLGYQLNL